MADVAHMTCILAFVGSYTRPMGHIKGDELGEGLYMFQLRSDGSLEQITVSPTPNPSFVVASDDGRTVYAVNEVDDFGGKQCGEAVAEVSEGGGSGGLSAFAFDAHSGTLTLLNSLPTGGADPCFVAQSASRVICANYSGGSVAAFSTRDDGGVGSRSGLAQFSGSGPNVARQEKAHAHQCVPAKSGRMVYVPDLGADQLRQLRLTEDGAFEELPAFVFETLPGGGPRHIAFNPTKADVCYCLHELGNVISVLSLRQSLVVAVEQVVSTLPADYVGGNLGADVHVSPDGKFVYASNRGHDSIAIFKVDMCTGHLSLAGCVAAGGNTPRNFAITPDGEFVLVALQVIYARCACVSASLICRDGLQ